MASPSVPIEMTFDTSKSNDSTGACREFWMRFPGLRGASDVDTPAICYYKENPYSEDLVVIGGLAIVTTASGNVATDLDVGLGDDAAGTNIGAEIADGMIAATLNTTGVKRLMAPLVLATPPVAPIWKAHGTSTDAFLSIIQRGDVDASALRWTLAIKVVPYKDLLNSNIELGALTVA